MIIKKVEVYLYTFNGLVSSIGLGQAYGNVMMNGVNGMGDNQNLQILGQQGVIQSNLVQICKYGLLVRYTELLIWQILSSPHTTNISK